MLNTVAPVMLTVAGACSGNRRLSSGCVSTTNILNCVTCPVESRLTDVAKPTRVTLPEFWSSASSALTCLATILPFESSLASTSTKVFAAKALSPEMSSNFVMLVIFDGECVLAASKHEASDEVGVAARGRHALDRALEIVEFVLVLVSCGLLGFCPENWT